MNPTTPTTIEGKKIPFQALLVVALAVVGVALLGQAIFSTEQMNAQFLDGPSKYPVAGLMVKVNGSSYTTNAQGFIAMKGGYHETLTIKVDDIEFESFQRSVLLEPDHNVTFSLLPATSDQNALVTFTNRNGLALPAGLEINVKAYCTKNSATIEQTTVNQRTLIVRPPHCGRLLISATAAGFEPIGNEEVDRVRNFLLTALPLQPPAKGSIAIQVVDEDTRQTISNGFTVYLRTAARNELISKVVLNNGQAKFNDVTVGEYTISATDQNQYAASTPVKVTVSKGITTPVVIRVSSKPKSVLGVRVVDESNQPILGARIVVKDSSSREIVAETYSTNEEQFVALQQNGSLVLQVNAPNFAWKTQTVTIVEGNDNHVVVVLEKCSIEKKNCGNLRVQVVNEEGIALSDVRVSLFNATASDLALLEPQFTDLNGQTVLYTIPSGNYFIRASVDDTWYVESLPFAFDAAVDLEQQIVLPIGRQDLVINVEDNNGQVVPDAAVHVNIEGFLDCPLTESCIQPTDEFGSAHFSLSRTYRFNVRVEKEGFLPYQTIAYFANQTNAIEWTITLQPKTGLTPIDSLSDTPQVRLIKVTEEATGRATRLLARGRMYHALLEVQFPQAGTHATMVRTGSASESSNDYLTISNVNVAGSTTIQTNSEYHPPQSEESDRAHEQGNALTKWAYINWTNSEAITAQVEVKLHVSADTLPNTDLPFYFRAQSKNDQQQVKRDPTDPVIGAAESVPARDALYANSYQELFREGQATAGDDGLGYCEEEWCLVEKRVYTNQALQSGFEPFLITPDITNQVEWTIVNNSINTVSDLNLVLLNGAQNPQSGYRITQFTATTNSGSFRSSELGFFHQQLLIPFIESGEQVHIKAEFQTIQPLDSALTLQVKRLNRLLFDNDTYFQTNATQFLQIENEPTELPLLRRSELTVHVTDQSGADAPNSIVSIQINQQAGSVFGVSDERGDATLEIPILPTMSVLTIRAQKPTYLPAEKTLNVTQRALSVEPNPFTVSLDQLAQRDQTITLKVRNDAGQSFLLTGFEGIVLKHGVIDEPLLNQSLITPIGEMILTAGEEKTIDVPFQLVENMHFKANKEISGALVMDWTDLNLRQTYRVNVPFTVEVNVGQTLSAENCLKVSDEKFLGTTIEGIAQQSVTLTNKCFVGGRAIPIQNVEARLSWNSDILGNVLVGLDQNNGETIENEVLRPGYVTLLPQLKENESATFKISFIPLNGRIGKRAIFEVGFNAQVTQEGGRKEIGEDQIVKGEVFIANLEQCLRFTPDAFKGMEIEPGKDEGTFKFNTKDCGPIEIDVRLCAEEGNEQCSGGTEGGIALSKKEFLNVNQDEEKVEVSRWPENRAEQIPGMYGITVQVKTPNTEWKKVGEYPVTIHPQVDRLNDSEPIYNYFFLDRYKITLNDVNNRDSVRLFNSQVNENIETEACLSDWQKATANPDFMGTAKSAAVSAVAGKLVTGAAMGVYQAATGPVKEVAGRAGSGFLQGIGWTPTESISQNIAGGTGIESYWTPASDPVGTETGIFGNAGGFTNFAAGLGLGIGFSVLGTMAGQWVSGALGGGTAAQAAGLAVSTGINIIGMGLTNLILAGTFAIPVLGLILALVMLIVQLAILFLSQPPACIPITMNLTDYIINLSGSSDNDEKGEKLITPDARDTFTDNQNIHSKWQLEITDIANAGQLSPRQEVGILLTRTGPLPNQPTYTILTVQAMEHYHGDNVSHIPFQSKADCKGEDQMTFNDVPCDRKELLRTEKFHLRVKTKDVLGQFVQPQAQEVACISGSRSGTTGPGALPKVKLNWSWNDQTGIQWDTCDAKNSNAVYCDATQFSIMVFKRIHEIDRSLSLNNYLMGICPREQNEQAERTYATISMPFDADQTLRPGDSNADLNSVFVSTQDVNTNTQQGLFIGIGQAGVSKLDRKIINRKKVYEIVAVNQSIQSATFSYVVDIQDPTFASYGTCDFGTITLQPLETKVLDCNQTLNLEPRFYIARGKTTATPDNNNQIIDTALTMGFYEWAQDPAYVSGESDCDIPRVTEKYTGKPGLLDFIKNIDYHGTKEAPTKETFLELAHFDAYLQRDNFSQDFWHDFYQTYQTNVLDAPEFFTGDNGLQNFIKNGKIIFTQKFTDDLRVMHPGKYHIEINIRYGDSWKLNYDVNKPYPIVIVTYYPIEEEVVKDTPLYYTPLNGKVGLYEGKYHRGVYGTDFNSSAESFSIQNGPDRMRTNPSDVNSKAIQHVNVTYERSFGALNAQAEKRGNLLSITRSNDGWDWKVSPSLATPLVMRVNEPTSKSKVFSYYQLLEDQQIFQENDSLMLWNGMGQCLGFDGQSLASAINQKADRKISTELDKNFPVIPKGYAFDWKSTTRTGDVWLKTILYSPLGHQYTVQGLSKNTQFLTPTNNKSGKTVVLEGILGMPNNYQGLSIDQTPDSLQSLFDLVEKGQVCITRTEDGEEYWWNEEALYNEAGQGSSVNSIENGLVGGETCIG